MDFRDYAAGASSKSFWFAGKLDLLKTLFQANLKSLLMQKDLKILNVGVGTGGDLTFLKHYGDVSVVDIDADALSLIPDDLVKEKQQGDVCSLPYADNCFDVVLALDVLEHVKQDSLAVDQILRVLKPGGYFISTVPAFNMLFSSHDVYLHHYRRYNKKNYAHLLKKFKKIKMGYWFFSGFLPAAAIRLLSKKSKKPQKSSTWHTLPFNNLFKTILYTENWFISKGVTFPFGLTLYGVHQKVDNVISLS